MPDIDYGQILEALNDKVDLSGSWSAPTTQYDDLTLGASGTTYTAPADGWYYFEGGATSGNKYVALSCNNMRQVGISISGVSNTAVILPVKKGNIVTASYSANTSVTFRFIYAQKTN